MEREIKFRAWDKRKKEMFYDWCIDPDGGWFGDFGEGSEDIALKYYKNGEIEVMQYTGLKDKNGKEIYEGDIVQVNGRNQEVFFKDGYFGWGQQHTGTYSFDPFESEEIEVIGNIYENPELIKENN